jgi:hypothetical protein
MTRNLHSTRTSGGRSCWTNKDWRCPAADRGILETFPDYFQVVEEALENGGHCPVLLPLAADAATTAATMAAAADVVVDDDDDDDDDDDLIRRGCIAVPSVGAEERMPSGIRCDVDCEK